MKFRRLSLEELELLKEEFIQFLVVNGLTPVDWEEIKAFKPNEADLWIDKFSDLVLEKSLSKINYLEFRDVSQWMVFKCGENQIEMTSIQVKNQDVSTINWNDLNEGMIPLENISVMYKSKSYIPDRATELFRMTQSGAFISDGKLFDNLKKLAVKEN